MKRCIYKCLILISLILSGCVSFGATQYISVQSANSHITECVNLLNGKIPNGYTRISSFAYKKEYQDCTVMYITENNDVILSSVGWTYERSDDATNWISQFYTILEDPNQNWIFQGRNHFDDVYLKNEIYAYIKESGQRGDGRIAVGIFFSRDLALLLNG
jgi:hypothetical protein